MVIFLIQTNIRHITAAHSRFALFRRALGRARFGAASLHIPKTIIKVCKARHPVKITIGLRTIRILFATSVRIGFIPPTRIRFRVAITMLRSARFIIIKCRTICECFGRNRRIADPICSVRCTFFLLSFIKSHYKTLGCLHSPQASPTHLAFFQSTPLSTEYSKCTGRPLKPGVMQLYSCI